MAENTNDSAVLETEEELTSYTTETNAGAGTGTSTIAPGYGTGRRKEAVARVRLVPGTGKWTINGRTLEEYFPAKLLQREVNSPIVLLKLEGKFDAIVLTYLLLYIRFLSSLYHLTVLSWRQHLWSFLIPDSCNK